ncbi:hypothetical protein ACTOB_003419 [Actinoplanes oblitus]|uniref:DUF3800 domain-containing protein n=1 Tax=Actinoplanes oblitus TaxID=3040509 RepID=A0ABY8WQM3_9ACTN|nr:hypothetical protein [Actinoplanes oblitus]WIM99757.1 hypothetical protein ACTOB_003419 [Actinoplanes oblitus]
MRSPLQGGLPPTGAVTGAVVEIACDESGFSGTNLLHSGTPVIAHASVDLSVAEATELIGTLRSGFRFSPHELKSGRFLRQPGAARDRFLAALAGRALVHLIDKEFFLVTRVVDLMLSEPSYTAGTSLAAHHRAAALALYRAGRTAGAAWDDFLAAFADLVRRRRQPDPRAAERFLRARDRLRDSGLGTDPVLTALRPAAVRAVRSRLDADDRSMPPPLEPLLPALAETVLFWSRGRRRVLVFHDEQSALTADRLTRLQQALAGDGGSPLAGLVMVDSRDDPRVQVADLLAGIARRAPAAVDGRLLSATSLRDPGA